MIAGLLIKYIFREEPEFCVMLGSVTQKGSTFAAFSSKEIWKKETIKKKLKSLLRLRWIPTEELIQSAAKLTLMESMFGDETDYGEGLFKINAWHNSQHWSFENLTESDIEKTEGLRALTILVRTKHRSMTSNYLHLNIGSNAPEICLLLHPMVVKIPVTSIKYYIDIDSSFAFNEIRKTNILNKDDLISYIYEIQFIQQKIALSLHELIYLIDYNEKNKGDALLIKGEISAINEAETLFSYLILLY